METWLTYRPEDFLLFSAETYWRLFALANAAVWPLQVATSIAVAALLVATLAGVPRRGYGAVLLLAAAWVVVAEAFLAARYEPINWAVAAVRPLFWVEAGLLAVLAGRLDFSAAGVRRAVGGCLAGLGLFYPLIGIAAGRPLGQAEVVGIAPDPTAIVTLGFILLARPAWSVGVLAIVPIAWLLASAASLLTLGASTGWIPLAAAVAAGVVLLAGTFARAEVCTANAPTTDEPKARHGANQ